jgi:A/G-specific adenine glycosylase
MINLIFDAMNHEIAGILVRWYAENMRSLPWRETRDPYLVWLSEVIMQQTRVNQGLAYYNRFAESFPTVFHLADASETEVLKHWQGLGYYSRARNLHKTAKLVAERYGGRFPSTSHELLKLPGIGNYTAAAIASIAYDEPAPVVDGNVVRVISRLFGVTENAQTPAGYFTISGIMSELLEGHHPGTFNQAVMEFGALQCVPTSPECNLCPLQIYCFAFSECKVGQLPLKAQKALVSLRFFNYLVILFVRDGETFILLNKRAGRDIWHNLYDFPSVENDRQINTEELATSAEAGELLGRNQQLLHVSEPFIHLLTHRKIVARFFRLLVEEETPAMKHFQAVKISEIQDYPVPRLIEKYFEKHPF